MAYGHVHFSFAYCNFHAIVTKFYFKRLREMSIVVLEGPVICQVISSINVKKQKTYQCTYKTFEYIAPHLNNELHYKTLAHMVQGYFSRTKIFAKDGEILRFMWHELPFTI